MPLWKRCLAECLGTAWLVLGGCGAALLAGPQIGNLGVALAFGLTVLTMAAALGHLSGAHLNPAVTVGIWAAGRGATRELVPYILSQVTGGLAAAALLLAIVSGSSSFALAEAGFACNGYADHSPGGYSLWSCALAEVLLTAGFVFVILGAGLRAGCADLAPVAIGLCLTLIHLVLIPVDNSSVNPARSTATALILWLFGGGSWALVQLWLFWAAPILGGVLGGLTYRGLTAPEKDG